MVDSPNRLCITIDLETDYAGLLDPTYESCDMNRLDRFFEVMTRHQVKLTVFVVGKTLKRGLPIVKRLREFGAEFELHSYSHDLDNADSLEEIQKGSRVFEDYFGRLPVGYRAPQGRITPQGMRRLQDEGFLYDSSVFPFVWPAWRYVVYPQNPHRPAGGRILELPFATFRFIRLIISLSWIKLLGWPVFWVLFRTFPIPENFVFDSHMHDFIPAPAAYAKLGPLWRFIYGRNYERGLDLFENFLDEMLARGYEFAYVSELCEAERIRLTAAEKAGCSLR